MWAGLLGRGLMIDYILTAAVGIRQGSERYLSVPSLQTHTLAICVAILASLLL